MPLRGACSVVACAFGLLAVGPTLSSAQCTGDVTDDFDGSTLGPLWANVSQCASSVTESDGVLHLFKPDNGLGFAMVRLAPDRLLCDDFDLAIDYTLSMPPAQDMGGSIHGTQLYTATGTLVAGAERYRQGSTSCVSPQYDSYKFYTTVPGCPTDAIYLPTSAAAGRFRLIRTGGTIEAFYWNDTDWVLRMSRPITTAAVYLQLNSGTNFSISPGLKAATGGTFDNFHVGLPNLAGVAPGTGASGLACSVQRNPMPRSIPVRFVFETPRDGRVTLRIYNAGGALVGTALDEDLPSGGHIASWSSTSSDGSRLGSGVYFAQLVASGQRVSTRVVLLP